MSTTKLRFRCRATVARLSLCLTLVTGPVVFGQGSGGPGARHFGQTAQGPRGVFKTTSELAADANKRGVRRPGYLKKEFELPGRKSRPQDPNAVSRASSASLSNQKATGSVAIPTRYYPQVVGSTFDAVTGPAETGAFPPDSMGAAGPTQFIVFVNGRLRSFNKATSLADHVLDLSPDDFFANVMTPDKTAALNFTADPQIRYDRVKSRWILTMIDAPSTSESSLADLPNRVLIGVSDAASMGMVSTGTVWSFYYVQQNTIGGGDSGEFLDYDSLGVDAKALYIGGNMFAATGGSFITTSVFVVNKASILNGGPIVVTAFRDLLSSGDGPDSPRGVDNFDPSSNEGYVIGSSSAAFGRLILRRISNPGGTPSISDNIAVTVNTTAFPIPVDHAGNTSGSTGRLDSIDDRLYAAHIRDGKLWTAHTIAVGASGVSTTIDPQRRDAVRWYELAIPPDTGTPTVSQSGTIFDNASLATNARQYFMPYAMVSGQRHAAIGFTTTGAQYYIDAGVDGRLVGDAGGFLATPSLLTSTTVAYNPPGDTGFGTVRRWGDYSFTSLDPSDDMTMWTVQEYCSGANVYGVRVTKLMAPPPATPGVADVAVPLNSSSTNVTITGISVSGSGFFDPGASFPNHIAATVSGGVKVNQTSYVDATHVTLNVDSTMAASGASDVTVTNPDGQSASASGILAVGSASPSPSPNPSPTPSPTPLPSPNPQNGMYGVITSPASGSVLASSKVTFYWSAGSASAYWLKIGNSVGGTDILNSGQTGGHYWIASYLPTDGRTLYVRLMSLVGGVWVDPSRDYVYTAQNLAVQTPTIQPPSGTFRTKVMVTLQDGTPGATIYYTINNITPTTSSTVYSAPFILKGKGTKTVKAMAVKSGVTTSAIATATLKIK